MRPSNLFSSLYLIAIYGFIMLPVFVLVLYSFQDSTIPVPPFKGPTLKWYRAVIEDQRLMESLGNSLIVALSASMISLVLGFLAAHSLSNSRFRLTPVFRALLTAPLTVSYLIIAMGLLITFNTINLPRGLLAVTIGHVVINLPLCFAIIYSQMGAHHALIERAARDLGATELKTMLLVTVPMLWPALFAAFFLSFTFSWDEFIIAFLLGRFDSTLPVEIWSMLRTGLNPKTNAVGSMVFLGSIAIVVAIEICVLRRKSV